MSELGCDAKTGLHRESKHVGSSASLTGWRDDSMPSTWQTLLLGSQDRDRVRPMRTEVGDTVDVRMSVKLGSDRRPYCWTRVFSSYACGLDQVLVSGASSDGSRRSLLKMGTPTTT